MQVDPRLERVAGICMALPEAVRADHDSHATFTVRKKVFAYFLNDHHGDGIVSVCTRAFPGENRKLIEAHPRKFYSPAYIGPRGWVGLRLGPLKPKEGLHEAPSKVDWDEVRDLVTASYLQAAPKRLRERVERLIELAPAADRSGQRQRTTKLPNQRSSSSSIFRNSI